MWKEQVLGADGEGRKVSEKCWKVLCLLKFTLSRNKSILPKSEYSLFCWFKKKKKKFLIFCSQETYCQSAFLFYLGD